MPACLAHVKPSMAIIQCIYVHYALWVSAQRCTPVCIDKWAYISLSLLWQPFEQPGKTQPSRRSIKFMNWYSVPKAC